MKTILIILTLLPLATVDAKKKCFPITEPPKICDESNHEVFTKCGATPCIQKTCPTRVDPDLVTICPIKCTAGCICKEGYVRLGSKCVLEKDCPKICVRKNEVYSETGNNVCEPTCEIPHLPLTCKEKTFPGCGCKSGYLRDHYGICVLPKDCPKLVCANRINEEFKECGPGPAKECEKSCAGKIPDGIICTKKCHRRCYCKDGYVRDKDDNCILEKDCPRSCSKKHEIFTECNAKCEATCGDPDISSDCKEPCFPGCICKKGYVRDPNDDCVLQKDCPEQCFGSNEVFSSCGSSCEGTCLEPNGPLDCETSCTPGCSCKKGYVRANFRCILPKDCPPSPCFAPNEIYKCGPIRGCEINCEKKLYDIECAANNCSMGCFCNEGHIRGPESTCMPIKHCPLKLPCKKPNEVQKCGPIPRCVPTCDNRSFGEECDVKYCQFGCFCDAGYIRDSKGDCIRIEKCPKQPVCGKAHEVYRTCGTACPRTCDNINTEIECTEQCVSGCFCELGYVRDSNGNCILPEDCPIPPICDRRKHEVYSKCGAHNCQDKCMSIMPAGECISTCVSGCVCENGYIRDHKGSCIRPRDCPPRCVNENEIFSDTGKNPCEATCESPNKPMICKAEGTPGCGCKEGYIRHPNRSCVLQTDCPAKN